MGTHAVQTKRAVKGASTRRAEPGSSRAENDCLARKYAGCHDDAHCPYCSALEQALRAAVRFDDGG